MPAPIGKVAGDCPTCRLANRGAQKKGCPQGALPNKTLAKHDALTRPFARWLSALVEAGDLTSPVRWRPAASRVWAHNRAIGRGYSSRQCRTFTGFAIMPWHPGPQAPLPQGNSTAGLAYQTLRSHANRAAVAERRQRSRMARAVRPCGPPKLGLIVARHLPGRHARTTTDAIAQRSVSTRSVPCRRSGCMLTGTQSRSPSRRTRQSSTATARSIQTDISSLAH